MRIRLRAWANTFEFTDLCQFYSFSTKCLIYNANEDDKFNWFLKTSEPLDME